jgi:hypothetical protein
VEKCGGAREATDDNIMWRMRFACWISKATGTLIAFPQQQWFRERASVLRYTYIACLVTDRNLIKIYVERLLRNFIFPCVILVIHNEKGICALKCHSWNI